MHVYLYIYVLIDTYLYIYIYIRWAVSSTFVALSQHGSKHAGWLRVKASHGHDTFIRNVGGPYHPPFWRCHKPRGGFKIKRFGMKTYKRGPGQHVRRTKPERRGQPRQTRVELILHMHVNDLTTLYKR